jgi:hypothetical protein
MKMPGTVVALLSQSLPLFRNWRSFSSGTP